MERKNEHVAILVSDKRVFNKKKILKRDEYGHYIMIKGSILQEVTAINVYATVRASGSLHH